MINLKYKNMIERRDKMKRFFCIMMSFLLLVMSIPMEGLASSVSGNETVTEEIAEVLQETTAGVSQEQLETDTQNVQNDSETQQLPEEMEEAEEELDNSYAEDIETIAYLRDTLAIDTSNFKETYGITYEELFEKCPSYLDNEIFEENILGKMKDLAGKGFCEGIQDEKTAEFFYRLRQGMSYPVSVFLGETNITETEYETYQKEVAMKVVQDYLATEEARSGILKEVNDDFQNIDKTYDLATDFNAFVAAISGEEGLEFYRNQGTGVTGEIICAIKDSKPVMEKVQEGFSLFDIVTEVMLLQEIEAGTVDLLIESLKYEQDSEIMQGLLLLKADIEKDPVENILTRYCTDKVIKALSKVLVESALGSIVGSPIYVLSKLAVEGVTAIYSLYNPSYEEIQKAYITHAYMSEVGSNIAFYKKNFKRNYYSERDIILYEASYSMYLSTMKIYMDACASCLKSSSNNRLLNQINLWSSEIGVNITYEKYILVCMDAVKADIDNGNLTITETGASTPASGENYDSTESIKAKFAAIQAQFVPNVGQTWTEAWGATQCFGFARMVFSKLFGCEMPIQYKGSAMYEYASTNNVDIVGQLVGSDVTTENVKNLMQQGKLGDIIQAYGAAYGQHTMVFVGCSDSGVVVYDCNTRLSDSDPACAIHQWTINWNTWVSFYGTGTTQSNNGITLYHASNYASIYGDGDGMFYDDSVNFVIDENGVLTKYNGWQSFVVIPDTVTAIGDNAFKNNTTMMSVEIPDSVKSIGNSAFYGCTSLMGILIPDSVETIGSSAFYGCTSMVRAFLPENSKFTMMSDSIFCNCSCLDNVKIPDTITGVGSKAFANCTKLQNITIPEFVTTIGANAFQYCISLQTIVIPDSVINIDEYAFFECSNLYNVVLSKELQLMGWGVFENCKVLNNVEIPKSLDRVRKKYDYWVLGGIFKGCTSLTNISFEDGITEIPEYVLKDCTSIKKIIIPDTVTMIEVGAFLNCSGLVEIEIPNDVSQIDSCAFMGCSEIRRIDIPDQVTYIGDSAFADCTSLEEVVLSKSLKTTEGAVFQNCVVLNNVEIPKSLDRIIGYLDYYEPVGLFEGCTSLTKITFEEGITEIPEYLFIGCTSLEEIEIPDTVLKIERGAFKDCTSLGKVVLNNGLQYIDNGTFMNCSSLTEINLPNTITTMGTKIFSGCTALEKVHLPESIQNIETQCFYNCKNLKEINFPETLTAIRSNAFYNCDALTELALPQNVTTIEANAFQDCDSLTSVVIPDSVTSIGNYTFQSCDLLASVLLGTGLQAIPNYGFADCGSLTSIVIPYNVTAIKDYAFVNNPKMLEITIPRKTTTINSNAFSYKSKTTVYGIVGTYAETFAADNNMKFTAIDVPATSLEISSEKATVQCREKLQLSITAAPANFTDEVIWETSDETVATVSDTGLVTTKKGGNVTITVTVGNLTKTCQLTVEQPVTGLYLSSSWIELEVGEVSLLEATVYPDDATDKTVTWASSNSEVASISENGKITALAVGSATITATAGAYSKTCQVQVSAATEKTYVTSITLSPAKLSLAEGETYYLSKTVLPYDANNRNVIWESSNPAIVKVSGGSVTAVSEGNAKITATACDGSNIKGICNITVTKKDVIVTNADEMQSNHPYSDNTDRSWTYTMPGATSISITFSPETEIEEDYDFIYIYNGKGELIGTYTGTELAGKTITVAGNTLKIQFVSDTSGTAYGFAVKNISYTSKNSTGNADNSGNGENTGKDTTGKETTVSVKKISVSGISKKIAAGKKIKLTANVEPYNAANQALSFSSSNKKYAIVSSKGVVTTKKAGAGKTVTITVKAADGSGVKATYKIKIMKHAVKSIKLSASSKSVKAGKSVKIKAKVNTTGKNVNKTLKWTSSNTKYATVSKSGKVKTKKAGKGKTVTITATSTDGTNKKAKIKIKIK